MGVHFVNPTLLIDDVLDATQPEALIYEFKDGVARLVGVEFIVFASVWHANHAPNDPPVLEGQLLHFVDSPNRFGLPAYYELHVWAWRDNPNGVFVDWNPRVSCEGNDCHVITRCSHRSGVRVVHAENCVQPDDAGYDVWRRVHNGLIDKRPAAIARCHGVADVVDAVRLARARGLDVAVRGGGHNVAGHGTLDRGLLIDLSPMKGIHVDPRTRTVRAQGGVLWKELNRETQVHGLATTGGVVGSTGIAGLTLGGGIGWLMPKYGLALDNLRAADLVTADGRVLRASADENADLFWAIRGGGGNFGIAASLEYNLHAVGPLITGGVVAHPLSRALDVLGSSAIRARTCLRR